MQWCWCCTLLFFCNMQPVMIKSFIKTARCCRSAASRSECALQSVHCETLNRSDNWIPHSLSLNTLYCSKKHSSGRTIKLILHQFLWSQKHTSGAWQLSLISFDSTVTRWPSLSTVKHICNSQSLRVSAAAISVSISAYSSIFFCHTNPLDVLLHHLSLWSYTFVLSVSSIFAICCPVSPLSLLCTCSNHHSLSFVSNTLNVSCPSDVLISNPISSCHSQWKS